MSIELKDLIFIKKMLTDDECDALIKEREDRRLEEMGEGCPHAFTGEWTESTFRQVELIPQTTNFDIVHEATGELLSEWEQYLKQFNAFHLSLLRQDTSYSHKYRLMKYDVGQWIHPHIDYDIGTVGSLTFALSDESEYGGGDFVFFNQYRVRLKKGEGMVFPANHFFVHEVEPVTSGVRYSVNSFIRSVSEVNYYKIMDYLNEAPDETINTPWRHQKEFN